jgi:hypothetical protein
VRGWEAFRLTPRRRHFCSTGSDNAANFVSIRDRESEPCGSIYGADSIFVAAIFFTSWSCSVSAVRFVNHSASLAIVAGTSGRRGD